jgi:outer membrane protein OmpA-like peptidoglycan-associated protein
VKFKILLPLLVFSLISVATAQTILRSASPDELIEKLNPNQSKTRSMRNLTPEVREKPAVDLSIQFEFDSAKIMPESKPLLDNLAKAINSNELRGFAFMVEGYTDGVGLPAYNLRLSDQRATAVLNYLALTGAVSRTRLKAIGKGSNELLVPDKPDAAENRRVRITLNS